LQAAASSRGKRTQPTMNGFFWKGASMTGLAL